MKARSLQSGTPPDFVSSSGRFVHLGEMSDPNPSVQARSGCKANWHPRTLSSCFRATDVSQVAGSTNLVYLKVPRANITEIVSNCEQVRSVKS